MLCDVAPELANLRLSVSVLFTSDAQVHELNREWRDRDKPTNVLPIVGQLQIEERLQESTPDALLCPATEPEIDRVRLAVALMPIAPGATDSHHVEHSIEKSLVIVIVNLRHAETFYLSVTINAWLVDRLARLPLVFCLKAHQGF